MQINLGTRRLTGAGLEARAIAQSRPEGRTITRKQLSAIARDAAKALSLRSSAAAVLKELVGCWGEVELESGLMVWPSNAYLCERTLLSDRAVRFAVRDLIEARLIATNDSPNGKRYAIRNLAGAVIDAYGFDLSPLVQRQAEFDGILLERKLAEDALNHIYDGITVARRAIEEALTQLQLRFPSVDTTSLERAFADLRRAQPRRGVSAGARESLRAYGELRAAVENAFYQAHSSQNDSARAGSGFRHKETNKESPTEAYQDASRDEAGAVRQSEQRSAAIEVALVVDACPEMQLAGHPVRALADVVVAAQFLRPTLGASRNAWEEAQDLVGTETAAIVLVYTLQAHADDVAAGTGRIVNPGGLFRSLVRKVSAGKFDLVAELMAMRRRRLS